MAGAMAAALAAMVANLPHPKSDFCEVRDQLEKQGFTRIQRKSDQALEVALSRVPLKTRSKSRIVEDLEAAIRYIRASDKPLAAYIFTNDAAAEARFLKKVSCGNTCVNDTMMFMAVHELPFGGVGPSGMGNYSGEYGFRTFSHMKAVMKRGWWPDLDVRYAPFTDRKFRLLRKLL